MSKTTLEILTEARELLSDPDRWLSNGEMAQKKDGGTSYVRDKMAHRFCMLGAVERIADCTFGGDDVYLILQKATNNHGAVGDFNDSHTHAEVLAAFDRAIELCQTSS